MALVQVTLNFYVFVQFLLLLHVPVNIINADCTNDFLEVKYDAAESTITCIFLDQPEGNAITRLCRIKYGDCSSELTETSQDSSTTSEVPLKLQLPRSGQDFCYQITASNGSNIVMVDGKISKPYPGRKVRVGRALCAMKKCTCVKFTYVCHFHVHGMPFNAPATCGA